MAITVPDDAYCEVADITRRTGKDYGPTTAPTTGNLETTITEVGQQINGVLSGLGFGVPISGTATNSLAILRNLNAAGAAAQAEFAVPGLTAPSARADAWRLEFSDGLKMLASRKMALPDATVQSSVPIAEELAEPSGEFSLDSSGAERDPAWDRSTQL